MLLYHSLNLTQFALLDLDQSFFINWGIFLVTTIALYQIILKPVLSIKELRHARTAGAKEEAAQMERDAQDKVSRYEALISEASKTGKENVDAARESALTSSNATLKEAREQASAKLEAELPKLRTAYEENKSKLAESADALSDSIVSRIIKTEAN